MSWYDGESWSNTPTTYPVEDIAFGGDNAVWIASGPTILSYRPQSYEWTVYSEEHGLPDSQVLLVAAGGGRVLFVDDEPDLQEAVAALLEHLGYQVVTVDSGIDALRHLSENPQAFDLIVLDMIMPGMGGRELYGHIRKLAPDMRVLLSTGFSGNTGISDVLLHERSDLIRKPYTVEALSQKIRAMLATAEHLPAPSCSKAQ